MTVFWRYVHTLSSLAAKFTIFIVICYGHYYLDVFIEGLFSMQSMRKVNSINGCIIKLSY